MAATEQLFNVRERKRFERHDIWERIAENGTISAAVMVFAAIAAVICALYVCSAVNRIAENVKHPAQNFIADGNRHHVSRPYLHLPKPEEPEK